MTQWRTIKRGSKELKHILKPDNIKSIQEYYLSSGFKGVECQDIEHAAALMAKDINTFKKSVVQGNGMSYSFRVHSNLWFNWDLKEEYKID